MTTTDGMRTAVGDTAVAYEALRNHVLTGVPGKGAGLVLLLREGLAAWLEGRRACSPAVRTGGQVKPEEARSSPVLSDEIHARIVGVLASMVLAG